MIIEWVFIERNQYLIFLANYACHRIIFATVFSHASILHKKFFPKHLNHTEFKTGSQRYCKRNFVMVTGADF